ncbi:MAG: BrnA antitoxin family protein [Paracoccaceae bacterium]
MPDLAKFTARQRAHFGYMQDAMRRLEWDLHNTIEMTGRIPPAWHEIAQAAPARRKTAVNLGLDEDVVKFFKSMGQGYGPRINEVLKSYMHARLAGVIKGAETINHYKARADYHADAKPRFGEAAEMIGEEWIDAPNTDPKAASRVKLRETLQRRYAEEGTPEGGSPWIG